MCNDCSTSINTQIWNIPDCSAGGFVDINQPKRENWVQLNGNHLVFDSKIDVSSIQVFDLSMRLLINLPVSNARQVELPSSLRGCMLIKINAENRSSEVRKWCSF